MAKFLTTQAISHELMILIREAKDKIILVSPFLQVNIQIQERLKTKSALGVLSEIVIIFKEAKLDKCEFDWMKQINDLKIIEKKDLHAKCYVNEEKAIICSMNLYDYSQQHNIEMGILITKESDPDVYKEIIEEINNLKINGTRKKIDTLESFDVQQFEEPENEVDKANKNELSLEQKMFLQALKQWRLDRSREEKVKAFLVLTNKEIQEIIRLNRIDFYNLEKIIGQKKLKQYGKIILGIFEDLNKYTIGKVINLNYQSNEGNYDKVKLKILQTGEEIWFDTIKELPMKNKHVAVKINKNWFNSYYYLD